MSPITIASVEHNGSFPSELRADFLSRALVRVGNSSWLWFPRSAFCVIRVLSSFPSAGTRAKTGPVCCLDKGSTWDANPPPKGAILSVLVAVAKVVFVQKRNLGDCMGGASI